MGEVSGDWNNTGARPSTEGPVSKASAAMPNLVAKPNTQLVLPQGKYDVSRQLEAKAQPREMHALPDAAKHAA